MRSCLQLYRYIGSFIMPKRLRCPASLLLAALAASLLLQARGVLAQQIEPATAPLTPSLERFLNPDGTLRLDRDFQGSIDARGFKLELDASGAPRFEPLSMLADSTSDTLRDTTGTILGDAGWDDRFGPPGPSGIVHAAAVLGDEVFIGGRFITIGKLRAYNIASWNRRTRTWSTLKGGVAGEVRALAVANGALYVGGVLTASVSGVALEGIAKWDPVTSEWSAIGDGVFNAWGAVSRGGDVYAIAVDGEKIFIGGNFYVRNNSNVRNLAMWDGTKWSALDPARQPNTGSIYALALKGDELYIGGSFTRMGQMSLPYLAVWNTSTRTWRTLDGGMNGAVRAIAVKDNDIYVGGAFTRAGSINAGRLARWDGSAWKGVGGGVDGAVYALTFDGNNLYVGGEMTTASGLTTNCIAKWNGGSWSMMGVGMGLTINGASQWTQKFVEFNPIQAIEFAPVSTSYVWAIAAVDGEVYAGGHFTSAGSATAHHLAQWNGRAWAPMTSDTITVVNDNGTDGAIFAMVASGDDIYIGGDFTTVGGVRANRVVRWNRSARRWSALGAGIDGDASFVRALLVRGSDLYVGGVFASAGGVAAPGIARWNGSAWSALAGGVGGDNPYVFALASRGSDLYVGGTFSTAGGVDAEGIARFDLTSSAWSALDGGVSNETNSAYVTTLLVRGNDLYVGGGFAQAGSLRANNIALWDGSAWRTLGVGILNGADGPVRAIAVGSGDTIYVGGEFLNAGGKPASYIARWDGSGWSSMPGGLNGPVQSILTQGNDLFIGGQFTASGSQKLGHAARWNGGSWGALGNGGVNGFVRALISVGGAIYAGGEFSIANGLYARNVASIEGNVWSSLGVDPQNGIYGIVTTIALHDTDVYIGGAFVTVGGDRTGSLARWDGERWHRVAPELNGPVRAIAVDAAGGLYVGGEFTRAGELDVNGLAYWDGARWSAVGNGMGGATPYVYALAISNGSLYVGGAFSMAGTHRTNRVARWDMTAKRWEPMGGGVSGSSHFTYVAAIVARGSDVYVGGVFPAVGAIKSENIAWWDGSGWRDLGGGVNNSVYTLAIDRSGDLLIGGDFRASADQGIKYMARWDGARLSPFPGVFRGPVTMIAANDQDVFVSGSFVYLSEVQTEGLARWDGSAWRNVGRGPSMDYAEGKIYAMAAAGEDLYVGGDFTLAGGRPSFNFAHWVRSAASSAPAEPVRAHAREAIAQQYHPNPTEGGTTLSFSIPRRGHTTIAIFNSRGEHVETLASGTLDAGPHTLRWEPGDLPSGIYFSRITCSGITSTSKVIVVGGER